MKLPLFSEIIKGELTQRRAEILTCECGEKYIEIKGRGKKCPKCFLYERYEKKV